MIEYPSGLSKIILNKALFRKSLVVKKFSLVASESNRGGTGMVKKEEYRNMVIANVSLWMFVILVARVFNPQFVNLNGLLSAVFNGEIVVSFYFCGIIFFALLSYISFICGLFVVFDETIGKIVRSVKALFGYHEFREEYYDSERYTSSDVLLIASYTFIALPLMLFLVWPALATALILIFILYCILSARK